MVKIAMVLDTKGYILNSGGARGADSAFEKGSTNKQIFLPFESFNGKNHDGEVYFNYKKLKNREIAQELVGTYHPAAHKLKNDHFDYMARNSYQILGMDLQTPVDFVIFWSEDEEKGGTSQALRIARAGKIPVLNLAKQKIFDHFQDFVTVEQVSQDL